jgi:hypothetical protein
MAAQSEPDLPGSLPNRQSSMPSRRRHRSSGPAKKSKKLRLLFFIGATLWSFLLGAGFLASAVRLQGGDVFLTADAFGLLAFGGCLALASGALAALAYQEWRRRLR